MQDTLKLQVEEAHDEIRAAASVLLFLGPDYVWPVHDLDRDLALAADRLEQVSRLAEIAESPELVAEIQNQFEPSLLSNQSLSRDFCEIERGF